MWIFKKKTHRGGGLDGVFRMTKEELRANLYQAYIASGYQDPVLIQEYIKIAESYVFDQKEFTQDDHEILIERLSKTKLKTPLCNEHPGDYVAKLVGEQRADAKIALRVIQQFQFATLPELVRQIELIAHG